MDEAVPLKVRTSDMKRKTLAHNSFAIEAFIALSLFVFTGTAFSQADFYKGKTIKIIRGGGPGGSGEFQTRALVKFLEKYIPGKPWNSLKVLPAEKQPTSFITPAGPTA
jgi:hypothetical protein